ncbi:MAG: ABC transporter ATP-binding protein [Gemmatimonadota bacterium]
MFEVAQLRKEYGDLVAVDGISFTAETGAIFGLLGPNGAGKTTTIGCISGLLEPTAGTVRVRGHDVVREGAQAKASLGVVPQEIALYEDLSAGENVRFWGQAYGLRGAEIRARVTDVLEITGLLDRAGDRVDQFSGGMKRRLNFACGIVHEPQVLLLDEPTVGVDPQSRVRLLDLVREQANKGVCVLYTTHYMEEAQSLCDRLAIIDHGHVIAQGSLGELQTQMGERDLVRVSGSFDESELHRAFGLDEDVVVVTVDDVQATLSVRKASSKLPTLLATLTEAGSEVRDITVSQPSLESLFIKLTGKELRE